MILKKKQLSNLYSNFFNIKYEKPLCLLFTFILTFSFNFLQMSLITKELIEHENKFNRKVFLYHESSEKRFSQFVIFCKKPQKGYHEVVYTQQNYREILIS